MNISFGTSTTSKQLGEWLAVGYKSGGNVFCVLYKDGKFIISYIWTYANLQELVEQMKRSVRYGQHYCFGENHIIIKGCSIEIIAKVLSWFGFQVEFAYPVGVIARRHT